MIQQKLLNPVSVKSKQFFVLSDLRTVKSYSPMHMDIRYVVHKDKPFVITSTNKALLKMVKHENDPYHITEVTENMLLDYCNRLSLNILMFTSCSCNVYNQKTIMNMLEIDHGSILDAYASLSTHVKI